MNTKVTVELWNDSEKSFLPVGAIVIEIPFVCGRVNVIMEAVGELTKWLGSTGAPVGLYRLGGDEDAKISWNGRRPSLQAENVASKTDEEEAAEAALQRN